MQRTVHTLAFVAAIAGMTSELLASGVGASYYVPGRTAPAAACSPGQCSPAADCQSCQRLGFACVDHATVAPCTAEGGCKPKVETFGWYQPNWRRWPGTVDAKPTPAETETAEDSLVGPYDTPPPEEEDKQAPPPIEDSEPEETPDEGTFDGFDPGVERPGAGVELSLPPRPELPGRPESPVPATPTPRVLPPRPGQGQPNFGDAPPSLPFGLVTPPNPGAEASPEWQPSSAQPVEATPVSLPAKKRADDGPPPLPFGFTQRRSSPAAGGTRLPAEPRYDRALLPASAHMPMSR